MAKVGRPTKAARPGERVSLGLKVTADTKVRLEAAADASGRSQSQEAEHRIERSFERDDVIDNLFGSRREYAMLRMVASSMQMSVQRLRRLAVTRGEEDWDWLEDADAFDIAIQAAATVFDAFRPAPDPLKRIDASQQKVLRAAEGIATAQNLLFEVAAADPAHPGQREIETLAQRIADDLGSLQERLVDRQPSWDSYVQGSDGAQTSPLGKRIERLNADRKDKVDRMAERRRARAAAKRNGDDT